MELDKNQKAKLKEQVNELKQTVYQITELLYKHIGNEEINPMETASMSEYLAYIKDIELELKRNDQDITYQHYSKKIISKVYGLKFKEARKNNNLSQVETAEMLHCSMQQISKIENGMTENINFEFLIYASSKLNCTPDFLIGLSNKMRYTKERLKCTIQELYDTDIYAELSEISQKYPKICKRFIDCVSKQPSVRNEMDAYFKLLLNLSDDENSEFNADTYSEDLFKQVKFLVDLYAQAKTEDNIRNKQK